MFQRYRERRRHRRQYYSEHRRFPRMRPSTQILILLVAALVIYVILTSGSR